MPKDLEKRIKKINEFVDSLKGVQVLNRDLKNFIEILLVDLQNNSFPQDRIDIYRKNFKKLCKR